MTITLDVAAQTLMIVGPDGVPVTFGPDPRFVNVSAFYVTAKIYYTNPATESRVKFLQFGADSVMGGRLQPGAL